jgi:putative aldouronate transport system substrate-binding protein
MGDDGKTKLNLLMASKDLPDIFLRTGWSKAEALLYGSQGLLLPLQDYLKELPRWNEYNIDRPNRLADITLPDGNIYYYGGGGGSAENHVNYQGRMWIWKPWVDKLMGGKLPSTTDEYYEYLRRVKTQDPNGNGRADEVPLSGSIAQGQWATDPTTFLLNAFLPVNTFISNTNSGFQPFNLRDGKVQFLFNASEYREGLRYLNRLYKEGLLDSQTFTMDGTQLMAQGSANNPHILGSAAGGYFGSFSDAANFSKGVESDEWTGWALLPPLKGPAGAQYSFYTLPAGGSSNGYVSQNCKNPNLAVNIFDFLTTDELTLAQSYGPKDIAWKFVSSGPAVDGGTATWSRIQAEKFKDDGSADWGLPFATIFWPADVQISSLGRFKPHELVENTVTNLEYILYQAQMEYGKYRPDMNTVLPGSLAYDEDDARLISNYIVSIGGACTQARVQFITGDMDVERAWDAYVQSLNNMDVQGYIALTQKAYDEYMSGSKK